MGYSRNQTILVLMSPDSIDALGVKFMNLIPKKHPYGKQSRYITVRDCEGYPTDLKYDIEKEHELGDQPNVPQDKCSGKNRN